MCVFSLGTPPPTLSSEEADSVCVSSDDDTLDRGPCWNTRASTMMHGVVEHIYPKESKPGLPGPFRIQMKRGHVR